MRITAASIAWTILFATSALHAAPVPGGGDRLAARDANGQPAWPWQVVVEDDEHLPEQLFFAGVPVLRIQIHPTGLVVFGGNGPDVAGVGPLSAQQGLSAVAPFWADLEPGGCGGGTVSRLNGPDSVTLIWRDIPTVGCPAGGELSTFSLQLSWDAQGVIHRLDLRYQALPTRTLPVEPRAGFRAQIRGDAFVAFELLPDTDREQVRGRAKFLFDGSSDGEAGAWSIEVDGAGQVVGELEPLIEGEDGELEPPDGVRDADNCPMRFNPRQEDLDGDGFGDACDPDMDNDDVMNEDDNCPRVHSFSQADLDGDAEGDACDPDDDGDGWPDALDRCPRHATWGNGDLDRDGIGDVCDPDADADDPWALAFRRFGPDLCPLSFDPLRLDRDHDFIGDACDLQPDLPCLDDCDAQRDLDGDGISDVNDRCPSVYDPAQWDADGDGRGNACDPDANGDGVVDGFQLCALGACLPAALPVLPAGFGAGL